MVPILKEGHPLAKGGLGLAYAWIGHLLCETSANNAVGASARYARSGVHGAYGARERGRVRRGRVGHGCRACVLAPRRQPLNVRRKRPRKDASGQGKRMKQAGEPSVRAGIAWYRRNQWARLLEVSADASELEPTWREWHIAALRQLRHLHKQGIALEKVPVDVDDLMRWCQSRGRVIDGAARSEYAAFLLQHGSPGPC